jgi:hypothetical protein
MFLCATASPGREKKFSAPGDAVAQRYLAIAFQTFIFSKQPEPRHSGIVRIANQTPSRRRAANFEKIPRPIDEEREN